MAFESQFDHKARLTTILLTSKFAILSGFLKHFYFSSQFENGALCVNLSFLRAQKLLKSSRVLQNSFSGAAEILHSASSNAE